MLDGYHCLIFFIIVSAVTISQVKGECANACNGRGHCSSYDMCVCHKNWKGDFVIHTIF